MKVCEPTVLPKGVGVQKEVVQWQKQAAEVQAQLERVRVVQQEEQVAEQMLQQLRASCRLSQPEQLHMAPTSLLSGALPANNPLAYSFRILYAGLAAP